MRNTKVKIADSINFGDLDTTSHLKAAENFKCYLSPQWEECIDSLNYLCQHKQVLMALIGVSGSGKTTFVQQFMTQASDTLQIGAIEAQQGLDTDELLTLIAADFKLSLKNKSKDLNENLEALLLNLQNQPQHTLLVIDNAHCLSNANLQALCYLATHQPTAHLHVLLVGDLPLQTRLENLDIAGAKTQVLALPSFNLEETEQYLQHCLNQDGTYAHQNALLPFSTAEIVRLNRLSGGIPGRINRLAMRLIQKAQLEAVAKQNIPAGTKPKRQATLLGAGLLLMGFAAIAVWLSQQHAAFNHANNPINKAQPVDNTMNRPRANNNLPTLTSSNNLAATSVYASTDHLSGTTTVEDVSQSAETSSYMTSASGINQQPVGNNTTSADHLSGTTTVESVSQSAETSSYMTSASGINQQPVGNNSSLAENGRLNTAVASNGANRPSDSGFSAAANAGQLPPTNTGIISSLPLGSLASGASLSSNTTSNSSAVSSSVISDHKTTTNNPVKPAAKTAVKQPSSLANTSTASQATKPKQSASKTANSNAKPLSLAGHTQFLLAAQPAHFSLQIMGSYNLNSITYLLKASGLGKPAHYFRTLHQGKAWYVLVYGNYPSRQAAMQAVNKLPQSIRSLNPWPRDFASIQAAIRAKLVVNATT